MKKFFDLGAWFCDVVLRIICGNHFDERERERERDG